MRRADRLLQIIQILRRSSGIVTAKQLADELEVTVRTIYRDMIAIEAMGAPVRGEAGVGYILEDGYDLPPLMFTQSELEVITLGMRFVDGHGDKDLRNSARDILAKIKAVIPKDMQEKLSSSPLIAPNMRDQETHDIDLAPLRRAINDNLMVDLKYCDAEAALTQRTIYPILIGFFQNTQMLAGYCTLREAFRWFRVDRIESFNVQSERYPISSRKLLLDWKAQVNGDHDPWLKNKTIRGLD
jgi:predicted DNA-binding transcriptional regulator YafY